MRVLRGEVVLVDFPFSSGTAQKLRPAVVVQSNSYNLRLTSTILAPITSNTRHSGESTQVLIDPATGDGRSTGLLKLFVIKCENLATTEVRLVRRKIGTLSSAAILLVDQALKASLGIS